MLFIETRAEIITYIVYVQFLPMLVNTPNLGAIYYLCDISKGKHMINLIDYFFPVHIFHRHLYSQKITWFKCYISTLYKMYHECVHNKFLVYSNPHESAHYRKWHYLILVQTFYNLKSLIDIDFLFDIITWNTFEIWCHRKINYQRSWWSCAIVFVLWVRFEMFMPSQKKYM